MILYCICKLWDRILFFFLKAWSSHKPQLLPQTDWFWTPLKLFLSYQLQLIGKNIRLSLNSLITIYHAFFNSTDPLPFLFSSSRFLPLIISCVSTWVFLGRVNWNWVRFWNGYSSKQTKNCHFLHSLWARLIPSFTVRSGFVNSKLGWGNSFCCGNEVTGNLFRLCFNTGKFEIWSML